MPSHVVSEHGARPANLSQVDVTWPFLRPIDADEFHALTFASGKKGQDEGNKSQACDVVVVRVNGTVATV